jgi:GPI-anchor transamidase subunit S
MASKNESEGGEDLGKESSANTGTTGTGAGEAMTAANARKHPPPEKPEAVWLRTKVILSFWALIVFLGLPVWWKTTSIYRARLPIQEMLEWSEGRVGGICSLRKDYS